MAKSKEKSNKVKAELLEKQPAILETAINIDKADVVAVAVARKEESIRNMINSINGEIKAQGSTISGLDKQLSAMKKELGKKEHEELASKTLEAFKTLIGKKNCKVVISHKSETKVKKKARIFHSVTVESQDRRDDHDLDSMPDDYKYGRQNNRQSKDHMEITHITELPWPGEMDKISDQITALQEQREKSSSQVVQLKAELKNIGSFERKARARMAEYSLSKSEEGIALLKHIEEIDDPILLT